MRRRLVYYRSGRDYPAGWTIPVGARPAHNGFLAFTDASGVTTDHNTTPTTPTVVVSPTSGAIPSPATVAAATAPVNSITAWLSGSMFGGIPNWAIAGGVAFLVFGGRR